MAEFYMKNHPIPDIDRTEYFDDEVRYLIAGEIFHESMFVEPKDKALSMQNGYIEFLDDYKDLLNDDIKFYYPYNHTFFHFLTDRGIPHVLHEIERHRQAGTEVTILIPSGHPREYRYHNFFFNKLREMGVKCKRLPKPASIDNCVAVPIKNCYTIANTLLAEHHYELAFNFFSNLIDNKKEPTRRVFLSRRNWGAASMSPEDIKLMQANPWVDFPNHYPRILDEKKLADFLEKECGVEIIDPEQFETFEECIEFFSSVKTLISTTSSGFGNMFFMQPGTTAIEFTTFITTAAQYYYQQQGRYETLHSTLHNHYSSIAMRKNMFFVSIPNPTRQAKDLLHVLYEEKNEWIVRLIRG